MSTGDLYWDPFEPSLRQDPYPLWKRLRDEAPVWWNERYDFWVLSRFHDIEAGHRDPATFSSAHGTTIELMTPEPMQTGMMIALDPPAHTRLRTLVSRAFTARRIAEIETHIRAVCASLLDAQVGRGSFDYVQDFGAIVPPTVISALLGIPEGDQAGLRRAIDGIFHIEEGVGMINSVSISSGKRVRRYLGEVLDERQAQPRDDMLTALVGAELTGEDGQHRRLSRDEAIDFGLMLFVAGTETVARLLGWAALVLADHPEQRAELAADPSLIPGAVEELLRYEPPSPVNARWTTRSVELHGQKIPVDAKVVLLTGAAGRDERAFEDPDRFDIHRRTELHLSLGYGIHYCLGAALARMEGRIALEETLRRFPTWEVDKERAVPLYTSTVRGYLELPIAV